MKIVDVSNIAYCQVSKHYDIDYNDNVEHINAIFSLHEILVSGNRYKFFNVSFNYFSKT